MRHILSLIIVCLIACSPCEAQRYQNHAVHTDPASGVNLLANGTFDVNVDGWWPYTNVTITQQTAIKRTGAGAMLITQGTTDVGNGTFLFPQFDNTSSHSFTFSAYIYTTDSAKTVTLMIQTNDWSPVANSGPVALTQNDWTLVSCTGTAPGTQTGFYLIIQTDYPAVNELTYVDDVTLTQN